MRILRTTERYEAGWREQNFIPDDETLRQVKVEKTQYLCGFADLGIRQNRTPYTKLTPFDVGKCAEAEKSHN